MSLEFVSGTVLDVVPPGLPTIGVAAPTTTMQVLPIIGPAGPTGPRGPAGTSVNAYYLHVQLAADRIWEITHSLGFYPAGCLVKDSTGAIVDPADIEHIDINSMRVTVGFLTSGTALVS